jgi:hypothetical protein
MPWQELIAWYEKNTTPARDDRVVGHPWAFARFSDGTRIEPHHRWIYRERGDLQAAFPDPYDAAPGKLTFLEWCDTEGRIRFPEFFGSGADEAPPAPARPQAAMTLAMAARLSLLACAPRAGRALRERVMRMLRREGVSGIARRLRGIHAR